MIETKKALFLIVLLFFSSQGFTEETKEQSFFRRAFGNSPLIKESSFSLFYNGVSLGDIRVVINPIDQTLISVGKTSLVSCLQRIFQEENLNKIRNLHGESINPKDLEFKIEYSQRDLVFILNPPFYTLLPESVNRGQTKKGNVPVDVESSIFSGAINLDSQKIINRAQNKTSVLNTQLTSFLNYKDVVLESKLAYRGNSPEAWTRGDVCLVKDTPSNSLTYKVGDLSGIQKGYLNSRSLGGLSIKKNYNTTPYDDISQGNYNEFIVSSLSEVSYFVNEGLVKKKTLSAGKYSIQDLALINGMNKIKIEIVNEFGQKEVLFFNETHSSNLLKEGVNKYELQVGEHSVLHNNKIKYDSSKGLSASGYFERGWTSNFANSIYGENTADFNLFGQESQIITNYGSIVLNNAKSSSLPNGRGESHRADYSLQFLSSSSGYHDFGLGLETRSKGFSTSFDRNKNYKFSLNAGYRHPFSDFFSIGLSSQIITPHEENLGKAYIETLALNRRISKEASSSISLSYRSDEYRKDQFEFGVSLSFSLPETIIQGHFNSEGSSSRINLIKNSPDREVLANVSLGKSKEGESLNAGILLNSRYGIVKLNESDSKYSSGNTIGTTSMAYSGSISFAKNNQDTGVAFGLPIYDSALIFKQKGSLGSQKIKLSNKQGPQSRPGFFGELIETGIPSYYVSSEKLELINPDNNNDSESVLKKETFTVKPSYKSVSLATFEINRGIDIKGILVKDKEKIVNRSGEAYFSNGERVIFFTNGGGRFFIEKAPKGKVLLVFLGDPAGEYEFSIKDDQDGLLDLGEIEVVKKAPDIEKSI